MQIHSQTQRVLPEDEAVVVVVGTGAVVSVRDETLLQVGLGVER